MVYVIKARGEKEEFDKDKIYKTCLRTDISKESARKIADEIEKKVYDGITTKEILKLIFKKLDKIHEKHSLKYDLKRAVSDLTGEAEFEKYVQHILNAHGYKTEWNVILKGEIVEHQIDIIAEKGGKRYYVECKHHINPHRFCGLQVVLQTWAAFDDLKKGGQNFDKCWLITNTKFSEHAIRYANGKKVLLMGWNHPPNNELHALVANKGLYPITILSLSQSTREGFKDASVLLVKELLDCNLKELAERTRIKKKELEILVEKAKMVLKS